jgi:hypothetical protein
MSQAMGKESKKANLHYYSNLFVLKERFLRARENQANQSTQKSYC